MSRIARRPLPGRRARRRSTSARRTSRSRIPAAGWSSPRWDGPRSIPSPPAAGRSGGSAPASGERIEVLAPCKPLGLLVYLSCSPGRTATREHLIDLLWADQDLEAARHSVRQAVWFLRSEERRVG